MFYDFGRKVCFAFLMEKCVFTVLTENCVFYGFERKVHFCYFDGKVCFAVLAEKCILRF